MNDGLLQVVEEAPPAAEAVEPDTPQAVGRIDFLEIGRASCRERV